MLGRDGTISEVATVSTNRPSLSTAATVVCNLQSDHHQIQLGYTHVFMIVV